MFSSLRYLILSITSRCNIHCIYCHQSASDERMDMSDQVIDKSLDLANNGQPLLIQITGGEPTLLPDAIDRIGYKSQRMKRRPRLALQTNGTLLTPQIIRLLKKYQIQVGLSIDGPPNIQEDLRGRANETLQGMRLLESAEMVFRVTTVISNKNISSLDKLALMLSGYRFCRGIGLDLLVEKGRGTNPNIHRPSPGQMRKGITQLIHILRVLNSRRSIPIILREMELVKNGSSSPTFCHAASGRSLAVQSDGSLFPCGQTIGDRDFYLGSLSGPSIDNNSRLTTLQLQSEDCSTCPLQKRCPGECPSRIHYNNVQESKVICELYRCLNALQ
jgi:uncharacterized protein